MPQLALQYLQRALVLEEGGGGPVQVQNSSSTHLNICAAYSALKRPKEVRCGVHECECQQGGGALGACCLSRLGAWSCLPLWNVARPLQTVSLLLPIAYPSHAAAALCPPSPHPPPPPAAAAARRPWRTRSAPSSCCSATSGPTTSTSRQALLLLLLLLVQGGERADRAC